MIVTVSGVPVPCEVDGMVQDIELIIFDQEELLLDMPDQITIDCLGSADIAVLVTKGKILKICSSKRLGCLNLKKVRH